MTATTTSPPQASPPPALRARAARWSGLVVLSAAGVLLLESMHVTAAALLGPIAVAIVFAVRGVPVRIPSPALAFAQAVVGCMIARSIPLSVLGEIGHAWPLLLASVGAVIAVAVLLGWALAHWRILPGTTAVWGSFPGAATAMVLMAEAFGADVRLVALMQYLRVLMVGVVATSVARWWAPLHAGPEPLLPVLGPVDARGLAATLALALAGLAVARLGRVRAGALLVPMFAGIVLQGLGWIRIELPWPLLVASYVLIGWSIGLRFTREILHHAAALLPRIVASIATLIVLCAGLAWLLVRFAHVDPLTAYLATSPGGADTVAIIAAASPVDVPFVMAMQSARFLVVAFLGPAVARRIARRVP